MSTLLEGFTKITNNNLHLTDDIFVSAYHTQYKTSKGGRVVKTKLALSKALTKIIKKEGYEYLDIYLNKTNNHFALKLSKTRNENTSKKLTLTGSYSRIEIAGTDINNMLLTMFQVKYATEIPLPYQFDLDVTDYKENTKQSEAVFIFR